MEKRDLYDENKKLTKKWIYKNDIIPENMYILVVSIFIINDKNEVLIEKRSKQKGGKYGFIAGHPKKGENSKEGIIAETLEEIGLKIDDPQLIDSIKGRNAFYDYYIYKNKIDITKLILQEEEVEEIKWVTVKNIEQLISEELFYENHIDVLDILKKYINNN